MLTGMLFRVNSFSIRLYSPGWYILCHFAFHGTVNILPHTRLPMYRMSEQRNKWMRHLGWWTLQPHPVSTFAFSWVSDRNNRLPLISQGWYSQVCKSLSQKVTSIYRSQAVLQHQCFLLGEWGWGGWGSWLAGHMCEGLLSVPFVSRKGFPLFSVRSDLLLGISQKEGRCQSGQNSTPLSNNHLI